MKINIQFTNKEVSLLAKVGNEEVRFYGSY